MMAMEERRLFMAGEMKKSKKGLVAIIVAIAATIVGVSLLMNFHVCGFCGQSFFGQPFQAGGKSICMTCAINYHWIS